MLASAGSGARAASSQRDGRVSHRGAGMLEDDPDQFDAQAERDRLLRIAQEADREREREAAQAAAAADAAAATASVEQSNKQPAQEAARPLVVHPASPSSSRQATTPRASTPSRPGSALSPGSTQTASSLLNPWGFNPGSNAAADPYTRHLHEVIRDLQTKVTSQQRELQLKTEAMAIQAEAARRLADEQAKRLRLYKTLFAQMLVSQYVKTWRTKRTLFRIQDLVFNLLPFVLKEYERNPSKGSTFDSSDVGFDGAAAGSVGGAGASAAARRKANESAEAVKLANAEHARKEKARMEQEHDAQIAAIYASAAAGGSVPTSPAPTSGSSKRQLSVVVHEAPSPQLEPSPIDSGILNMSPTNARGAQTQALAAPDASDPAGPSSRRIRAAAQAARERPRHLQLDVTPAEVARMGRLRKVRRGARMLATPIVQLTTYIEDVLLLLQQAIIALIARLPLAQIETERLAQRNVQLKCELTDLAASQQNEKQDLRETRAALAQLRTEHERLQRSYEIVKGEKALAVHHLVLHGGWNPGRETQFGSMSVAHLSKPTFYRPRDRSQLRTASSGGGGGGSRSRSASPATAAGVGRAAASEQSVAASSSRAQSASRSRPRSAAPVAADSAAAPTAAVDDGSETDFLFQREETNAATAEEPSHSSRRSTATAPLQPPSSLDTDATADDAQDSYAPEEKEAVSAAQPQSPQPRGRSSARREPRASSRSPSAGRATSGLRSSPYRATDSSRHLQTSSSSRPRPHSAAYTSPHIGSDTKGDVIAEEQATSPERERASRHRSGSPPQTLAERVRCASARASLRELSPGRPSALFTSNKRFDSGDIGGTNMYLGVGSASFDRLTYATMEAQQRNSSHAISKAERDGFNNSDGRDATGSKRDRILEARREQLIAAQAVLERRERKRLQAQAEAEEEAAQKEKARARRPSSSPSRHASYREHIAASPLNARPVTASGSRSRPSSSQKLSRPHGASSAGAQRGPVVRRVLHFPSQQHEESVEEAEERAAQLQRSLGKPRRTALEASGLAATNAADNPEDEEYPDSEAVGTAGAASITIRDEEGGDDSDDDLAAPAPAAAAASRKTPARHSQSLQKSASAKRIADSPYKQQLSSSSSSHSLSHKKHAARPQPTDVHMIDLAPISAEQRQQRQQLQQDRPRKVLSRAEELHNLAAAAVATTPRPTSARAPPSGRKAEPLPPQDIASILAGGHDYESYVREIEGINNREDAPHERRTEPVRSPPAASTKPARPADPERENQRRAVKAAELAAKIEQAKHTQLQQQQARSRRDDSKQSDHARRSSPKRSPSRSPVRGSSSSSSKGSSKSSAQDRADAARRLQAQDRARAAEAALSDEAKSAQLAAAAADAYDRYQAALAVAQAAKAVADATRQLAVDPTLQTAPAAASPSPARSSHSPHSHVAVPTADGGFRLSTPELAAANAAAEPESEQPPLSSHSRSGAALRIVREEEDEEAQAADATADEQQQDEAAEAISPDDASAQPVPNDDATDSRPTSAQRLARFKANMKKQ